MIQQMPLQMLGSSERPPTPVIRADKLLPFILAQVPSLAPAVPELALSTVVDAIAQNRRDYFDDLIKGWGHWR